MKWYWSLHEWVVPQRRETLSTFKKPLSLHVGKGLTLGPLLTLDTSTVGSHEQAKQATTIEIYATSAGDINACRRGDSGCVQSPTLPQAPPIEPRLKAKSILRPIVLNLPCTKVGRDLKALDKILSHLASFGFSSHDASFIKRFSLVSQTWRNLINGRSDIWVAVMDTFSPDLNSISASTIAILLPRMQHREADNPATFTCPRASPEVHIDKFELIAMSMHRLPQLSLDIPFQVLSLFTAQFDHSMLVIPEGLATLQSMVDAVPNCVPWLGVDAVWIFTPPRPALLELHITTIDIITPATQTLLNTRDILAVLLLLPRLASLTWLNYLDDFKETQQVPPGLSYAKHALKALDVYPLHLGIFLQRFFKLEITSFKATTSSFRDAWGISDLAMVLGNEEDDVWKIRLPWDTLTIGVEPPTPSRPSEKFYLEAVRENEGRQSNVVRVDAYFPPLDSSALVLGTFVEMSLSIFDLKKIDRIRFINPMFLHQTLLRVTAALKSCRSTYPLWHLVDAHGDGAEQLKDLCARPALPDGEFEESLGL